MLIIFGIAFLIDGYRSLKTKSFTQYKPSVGDIIGLFVCIFSMWESKSSHEGKDAIKLGQKNISFGLLLIVLSLILFCTIIIVNKL